ncbi:hydroxymethylglutaryl-CoA synthase [Nocardia colli]|uniref:Hydroxymethylglutaryl-CoA synthase n=1 Tax=Nocardia colli TaxID=2545717 RepID=A0A5N0EN84_9NOCA|nr:hydroxymethylglutaryl-CoA synthase [Nocardia colli]KAA8889455.1 hydroxymethylglutaryl-CoA synthase [Nocardia colli]
MTTPQIGIHDLSIATTHYRLDHIELARHSGVDADKYLLGIGQEQMSVAAADEDIVTMAAAAAAPIIERHGAESIRTVLLATETGVDQSKSAALFLHPLIGLPHTARVVELKQACYSATAALQFATGLIACHPDQRVLVIATDIAKYELDSAAEATQGAAAAAMLVSADPAILRLEPESGVYSTDIMDFWRPNYRDTAVVDGKLSIEAYLHAIEMAWQDYRGRGGRDIAEFAAFCYHQPFTKMAFKAHRHLLRVNDATADDAAVLAAIDDTTRYNRLVGNSYTASLYLALAALLDHRGDLTDQPIALISYGSGCVAEFVSGVVLPGYQDHLRTAANNAAISGRKPVDYARYRDLHDEPPTPGRPIPEESNGPYRLTAVTDHKRLYSTH